MKKGFTLIELLIVIIIIGIAAVSSIISFSEINDGTKSKNQKDILVEIQRAALLYYELNDSVREELNNKINDNNSTDPFVLVPYSVLVEKNYVRDVLDEEEKYYYTVKIFVENKKDSENNEHIVLNTCITKLELGGATNCIYDSEGTKL